MLSRRALISIGGTLLGGIALAWMLPPTKPIGGPNVAQVARGPSPVRDTAPAVPDTPPPAPLPEPRQAAPEPLPERADGPDRVARLGDADARVAADRPPTYFEDAPRNFRIGYRMAERGDIEEPRDCAQLESPAQNEGCLSFFSDSDPPEDEWDQGPGESDR